MASRLKRNKRVIGETLSVLDANGGQLSQTARETEIPKSTILGWSEHYANDPLVARYRTLKNEELADRFRAIAGAASERLYKELANVSVDKLATVAAISTDKQLLLTGNATSISESKSSQINNAKQSYLLAALPDLQSIHPDWPIIKLQQEAEARFSAWYASLNIDPLVTDTVQ